MSLATRVAALKTEGRAAAEPHLAAIDAAMASVQASLEALHGLGFTTEVSWPYGRGPLSNAKSTTVGLKIEGMKVL